MAKELLLRFRVDDKGNVTMVKLNKNIKKTTASVKKLDSTMKKVMQGIALWKGIALVGNSIRFVSDEVFNFNKRMKQTEGVAQVSATKIEELKDLVIGLSNASEHSSSKIASAVLQISKMGVKAKEQIHLLPPILDLATAAVVEVDEAVQVAAQTTKSFGLEMAEMGRVANVIQSTVSGTAIGFEDYAEAMKFIAPIAKTLNVSIEETSALIGKLGDIGLKGTIAGTSLKNIFVNLLKPTDAVAVALDKMGLRGKSLATILSGLRDNGFGVKEFLDQFNLRALGGALAISDMSDAVNQLNDDLDSQKVKVGQVAGVIRTAWIDQLQHLRNVIVNVGIEFSRAFEDVTTGGALDDAHSFFINLQKTIRENRKEIREFVQGSVTMLIDTLKWFVDNRQLLATAFKIFLSGLLIEKVIGVTQSLTSAVTAMKAFGLASTAGLNGVPKTITGITSALGPLTLALIAVNEVLDLMAGNLDRAAVAAAKAGGNQTPEGVKNKREALEEIRPFVLALSIASERMEDAVKAQEEMEKNSKVSVSLNQEFVKAVIVATKEFKAKSLEIKADTGLDKTFLDMFKTIKEIDRGIFLLGRQEFKMKELAQAIASDSKVESVVQAKDIDLQVELPEDVEGKKLKHRSDGITFGYWERLIALTETSIANQGVVSSLLPVIEPTKSLGGSGINMNPTVVGEVFGDTMAETFIEKSLSLFPKLEQALSQSFSTVEQSISDIVKQSTQNATPLGDFTSGGSLGIKQVDESTGKMKKSLAEIKELFIDVDNDAHVFAFRMDELNKQIQQANIQAVANYGARILDTTSQFITAVNGLVDAKAQREMDIAQDSFNRLKEDHARRLNAVKDDKRAHAVMTKKFDTEEASRQAGLDAKSKERAKKQKRIQLITAGINIASGVLKALGTSTNVYEGYINAGIVAGMGAIQLATISAQKYSNGGLVTGAGNGTSDSISALLSRGEFVVPAATVSAVGGPRGVEERLEDDVNFLNSRSSSGTVVLQVGTIIGDKKYERDLFQRARKELQRWK